MFTITWKLRLSVSALTLKCSHARTNPVKSFRHHDECWCTKCLHQLEIGIGKGKSRGKTERVALKPMSQEVFLTLTKDFLHSLTHCLIFFFLSLTQILSASSQSMRGQPLSHSSLSAALWLWTCGLRRSWGCHVCLTEEGDITKCFTVHCIIYSTDVWLYIFICLRWF